MPNERITAINELDSRTLGSTIGLHFIHVIGTIYLIGGNVNERLPNVGSRWVSSLNLGSGSFRSVQSLQEAVVHPAVATSGNAIAICGGVSNGLPTSSYQIYSACTEK